MQVRLVALLALVHASVGSIFPVGTQNSLVATTVGALDGVPSKNYTARDGRRRGRKKSRSTSSSSGERFHGNAVDSLGIEETESDTSSSDDKMKSKTRSGEGWRRWHRKCQLCPEEMVKKWRDPTIKWVCGGYQRARRSFKSECMMYYRNCQDGTMFVKLHDHRCDEKMPGWNNGKHFFYDYRVRLLEESSSSQMSSGESESSGSSDDSSSKTESSSDMS